MSRLGKTAIALPKGVELQVLKDGSLQVKGPKGTLHLQLPPGILPKIEGKAVTIERNETILTSGALHGLYRSLINNAIIGVSEGFEKRLTLIGVGYRAAVVGQKLDLQIGYSHPTIIEIPKEIQVIVEKGTLLVIKGVDKHAVGQFAAIVRAARPPEPYKGKGIRYEKEFVRKKEGKAAKGKA